MTQSLGTPISLVIGAIMVAGAVKIGQVFWPLGGVFGLFLGSYGILMALVNINQGFGANGIEIIFPFFGYVKLA